jgi:hypothetical protein
VGSLISNATAICSERAVASVRRDVANGNLSPTRRETDSVPGRRRRGNRVLAQDCAPRNFAEASAPCPSAASASMATAMERSNRFTHGGKLVNGLTP